ncbi:MAG: hypothetical protein IJS74_03565 [Clostridia bacterium]|nr:hypothetical protein [Clostridia bacterium]
MRKFIIIFVSVVVLVFAIICADHSLSADFLKASVESYNAKEYHDLGFIAEEYNGNIIKYNKNGVVVGECIKIKKNGAVSLNKICDSIGLVINKRYQVGEIEMIEGSSACIKYRAKDQQNNIQIAIDKDLITIASPIIYGSY